MSHPDNLRPTTGEDRTIRVELRSPESRSFRVMQVCGIYSLAPAAGVAEDIELAVPAQSDDWRIGAIVGPSGSGKSTIARRLFGDRVRSDFSWPSNAAMIDGFPEMETKSIISILLGVGLGSVPAWIRPYHVLSTGEKARADLARAIAEAITTPNRSDPDEPWRCLLPPDADHTMPLIVYDEFTSVVDRQVAVAVATGINKRLRSGRLPCRFVAISCHYDILEWLEPDWIIDMATKEFARRRLRRPEIRLEVEPCKRSVWNFYRRHHYLSANITVAARCYQAFWDDTPVAFCALSSILGRTGALRISRLVVLPEFQGMGIGGRLADFIAAYTAAGGVRVTIATSHQAMIRHCSRSPEWKFKRLSRYGNDIGRRFRKDYRGSLGRPIASFEYVGRAKAAGPRVLKANST